MDLPQGGISAVDIGEGKWSGSSKIGDNHQTINKKHKVMVTQDIAIQYIVIFLRHFPNFILTAFVSFLRVPSALDIRRTSTGSPAWIS